MLQRQLLIDAEYFMNAKTSWKIVKAGEEASSREGI